MPGQAPVGDTVGASNSNSDDGSIIGCDPKDDDSFRLLQAVAAGASPPAPFGPDRGAIDAAMSGDGRCFYELRGSLGVVGADCIEGEGRLAEIADGFGGQPRQFGPQRLAAL